MNAIELTAESNRIEGITRPPTSAEIAEYERFLTLETLTVGELQRFVSVYQPGARLRDATGCDIIVGSHRPPPGGPKIVYELSNLLEGMNTGFLSPWAAHVEYETLHPFTDGNGRSGRMLWHWMMLGNSRREQYGFLHYFYYQTLQESRK